jgi:hypothetical protein
LFLPLHLHLFYQVPAEAKEKGGEGRETPAATRTVKKKEEE